MKRTCTHERRGRLVSLAVLAALAEAAGADPGSEALLGHASETSESRPRHGPTPHPGAPGSRDVSPVAALAATSPRLAGEATELIVDVQVNRRRIDAPQVIRVRATQVWVSLPTLRAAGLKAPADAPAWVALHDIVGDRYRLDETRLQLDVTAPIDRFETTHLHANRPSPAPAADPSPLALIVGYDLAAGRDRRNGQWTSLLLDTTLSRGRMFCSTRHLGRSEQARARLDSQCVADWPERRLSLTMGDAISRANALSAPVRYAGARIGTDFSLQPTFHTQPLLGIEGSARLPSILEIWTQQQLVMRTELPPGPFQVEGIPALSGSGHVSAVITDALGRTTLLDAPFYSESSLLRPGLDDWAVEAGRLRTGFLTPRDRYADPFVLGSWRRGLTPWWTAELRTEAQRDLRVFGTSHALRLGRYGIVDVAASTARPTPGAAGSQAYSVAYSYRGRRWNVGSRYLHRDRDYVDLGYPTPGSAPLRDAQLNVGVRAGKVMMSAGGLLRETEALGRQRFLTGGASIPIGGGVVSLTAFVPRQAGEGAMYGAHFTLPLSIGRTASTWVDRHRGESGGGVSYQRSVPAGLGLGYRFAHETSARGARTAAGASYLGDAVRVDVDAAYDPTGVQLQGSAAGAFVATREGMFLSQDHSGSFAVVTLPDPGTRIYRDNQLAAVTDARGHAIVPKLRPYESNLLRAASEDMAFTTHVVTDAVQLTPGRRQVVRARFEARASEPLALRLRRNDGSYVPAGAVATAADGDTAPIGHDGLLYLQHAPAHTENMLVHWAGGRCVAPVSRPQHSDATALPDIRCEDHADAP